MTRMKPKKFLFVIDNLGSGGAQRQMVNLAVGLHRCQHQVEFFCYSPGDLLAKPLHQAGIPVHTCFKRGRFSFDSIFALRRLILKEKYDLVLSFLTTPNFYNIAANLLLGRKHPPVVVSERFCDLPGGVSKMDRFVRFFYRFANHITVNSHHQRIGLEKQSPILKGHTSTIYNGYDLSVFVPAKNEIANAPLRILTIASVSPYKNGICLVEALRILRDSYGISLQADWIGVRVMFGERLAYLNEMDQKIKAYGLEQQWHWLGERSDIVDQYHQHDVLVHPSFGEGLPNVVCEALSCARPVIISNVLDHARLVQDGESGFLFDHQNPADLAEKLFRFHNLSVEERMQMGQCGRKFAEENLSLDRFVAEYERLFQQLLKA